MNKEKNILFNIDCVKNHKENFDYCLEELIKDACDGYFEYSTRVAITMDLLKAINKQAEELWGWDNER